LCKAKQVTAKLAEAKDAKDKAKDKDKANTNTRKPVIQGGLKKPPPKLTGVAAAAQAEAKLTAASVAKQATEAK
jgi:hypothetical protein